jgi:hypothetical protein
MLRGSRRPIDFVRGHVTGFAFAECTTPQNRAAPSKVPSGVPGPVGPGDHE